MYLIKKCPTDRQTDRQTERRHIFMLYCMYYVEFGVY